MRSFLPALAARGATGVLLVAVSLPLACAWGVAPDRPGAFPVEFFGVQAPRGNARLLGEPPAARLALEAPAGGIGPEAASRVEMTWPVGARSELRGLAALSDPAAGGVGMRRPDPYRLADYRLTWRYALLDSPQLAVKLGVTARLRDARATLYPGAAGAGVSDTNLLPLLHASIERPFGSRLSLAADIDAMALPQGHALDAGLRLRYAMDRDWSASLSYRILDGSTRGGLPLGAGRLQYFGVGVRRAF